MVLNYKAIIVWCETFKEFSVVARDVLWSEGGVCENPMMAFPIRKSFNTVMFIDRTAAPLCRRDSHHRKYK